VNKKDSEYILALQTADNDGVRMIYQDFAMGITQWVKKNSGTVKDAEDIFNEALVILFDKVNQPDFELTYPFNKLLFGICRNLWLRTLTKNKRDQMVINEHTKTYSSESSQELVAELIEEDRKYQLLDKAFAKLSPICQQLLTLIKQGLKPVTIVEQLKMNSTNTLYRRKKACMDRWKSVYQEYVKLEIE